MATEQNIPVNTSTSRRLWFGFAASAIAWVSLGCIDILINWRACMHQQDYGIPPEHPGARILIGVVGLVLLAIPIAAGAVSFRNWQQFSREPLLDAHAVERHQFMAYGGILISITLGAGILLLAITPLFLDICWRAR
jgi:hypothetical protein